MALDYSEWETDYDGELVVDCYMRILSGYNPKDQLKHLYDARVFSDGALRAVVAFRVGSAKELIDASRDILEDFRNKLGDPFAYITYINSNYSSSASSSWL